MTNVDEKVVERCGAEILYFDDERKWLEGIITGFALCGVEERDIALASNLLELNKQLTACTPRVVVIDWLMGERAAGQIAIQFARSRCPFATVIVYSFVGSDIVVSEKARRSGAHCVLAKDDCDWKGLYQRVIVGKMYSIDQELTSLHVSSIFDSSTLPDEVDTNNIADQIMRHQNSDNAQVRRLIIELSRLVEKLNTWEVFDVVSFSDATFGAQVKTLLEVSGIGLDELRSLFEGADDCKSLEELLGTISDFDQNVEIELLHYVLWRSLKWSRFSPVLHKLGLELKGEYKLRPLNPPWDEAGLKPYVLSGPLELQTAAEWMNLHL